MSRKNGMPHSMGTAEIVNAELKRVVMLVMENFKFLEDRIKRIEVKLSAIERRRS